MASSHISHEEKYSLAMTLSRIFHGEKYSEVMTLPHIFHEEKYSEERDDFITIHWSVGTQCYDEATTFQGLVCKLVRCYLSGLLTCSVLNKDRFYIFGTNHHQQFDDFAFGKRGVPLHVILSLNFMKDR